jgi:serine/threonine protein kinase
MEGDTIPEVDPNEVEIIKQCGSGGHGDVFQAIWNGTLVAAKFLKKYDQGDEELRKEIIMFTVLKNEYILQLYGMCSDPPILLTEYLPQRLDEYLQSNSIIPYHSKISILLNVARGLEYMHHLVVPVGHFDMKSANVMLTAVSGEGIAKIIDFGTSKFCSIPINSRFVDNPIWLAPEILSGKEYDWRADIYAYGVVMWEVHYRRVPFGEFSFFSDIESEVIEGRRPASENNSNLDYVSLMVECWAQEPEVRPDMSIVVEKLELLLDTSSNISYIDQEEQQIILLELENLKIKEVVIEETDDNKQIDEELLRFIESFEDGESHHHSFSLELSRKSESEQPYMTPTKSELYKSTEIKARKADFPTLGPININKSDWRMNRSTKISNQRARRRKGSEIVPIAESPAESLFD